MVASDSFDLKERTILAFQSIYTLLERERPLSKWGNLEKYSILPHNRAE